MITNNIYTAEAHRIMTKLSMKNVVKNQGELLIQMPDELILQGQEIINNGKTNKVSFTEVRNFLAKLFKARKAKKVKEDPFIQVSEKFTPHERELILGDEKTLKEIREMLSVRKTPFKAYLVENSDQSIRRGVFNIGSKTMYIDMNKATDDEISTLVNNLIYYPYGF